MTSLEHAAMSCRRTLRRHAAGEHHTPIDDTIRMWQTEWNLRGHTATAYVTAMRAYAQQLAFAKQTTTPDE